jgi:hypothetical protein
MSDKRSTPRLGLHPPAACYLYATDGSPVGVGVVEDISAAGIRLFVTRQHVAGETLAVEVSRPPLVPFLHLELVVIWSQAAPGGFLLGGRFLAPLPEERVRALAGGP